MLLVTIMILYNERSIQQIHHHTNHEQNLQEASSRFNLVKPNFPGNKLGALGNCYLLLTWLF